MPEHEPSSAAIADREQVPGFVRHAVERLWFVSGAIVLPQETAVVARAPARGRRGRGANAAPPCDGPPLWGEVELASEQRQRWPYELMCKPCKALTHWRML